MAAMIVASASQVQARSGRDLDYRAEVIWPAALRLLRVELGYSLVERDQEAKYLLFQYQQGPETYRGSLELVERRHEDGRRVVRVFVSLPTLPSYVELHLIDRLERKLRDEVGPPLAASENRPARGQERRNEDEEQPSPDGGP
jgi:hypothetical protein